MFIKNIHVSLWSINLCLENGPGKKCIWKRICQIHQIRWIKYKYKYMVWNLIKYKYKYAVFVFVFANTNTYLTPSLLWLHGLYRLYGPRPLSPDRLLNLITHSLCWKLSSGFTSVLFCMLIGDSFRDVSNIFLPCLDKWGISTEWNKYANPVSYWFITYIYIVIPKCQIKRHNMHNTILQHGTTPIWAPEVAIHCPYPKSMTFLTCHRSLA